MGWRIGLNQSKHMINGLLAIKTHVDASCEGGAGRPMVVHNEEIKHITKPHVAHDSQNGWTCFKQNVLDESTYLGTGFQHCRFQAMVRKKDGLEHSSHKRDMASSCAARSSRASLSRGYCNKNVILSTKPSSLSVKGFDCETWHHICFVSRSPNNNRKKKGSQDHQVRLLSLELKSGFTTLEMVGISTRDMLGWWKIQGFFRPCTVPRQNRLTSFLSTSWTWISVSVKLCKTW